MAKRQLKMDFILIHNVPRQFFHKIWVCGPLNFRLPVKNDAPVGDRRVWNTFQNLNYLTEMAQNQLKMIPIPKDLILIIHYVPRHFYSTLIDLEFSSWLYSLVDVHFRNSIIHGLLSVLVVKRIKWEYEKNNSTNLWKLLAKIFKNIDIFMN